MCVLELNKHPGPCLAAVLLLALSWGNIRVIARVFVRGSAMPSPDWLARMGVMNVKRRWKREIVCFTRRAIVDRAWPRGPRETLFLAFEKYEMIDKMRSEEAEETRK